MLSDNQKSYFIIALSFLIYIYPISLVLSVFIANAIVYLVALSFFLFLIIENKLNILKKNFYVIFIIFWSYIFLRSFFSEQILFSLKSSLTFIRYLFFILSIDFVINSNPKFLNFFTKIIITLFIVLISDALLQYIYGKNILGYDKNFIENFRISGLFGKELILGSFLARLGFLVIGLMMINNFKNLYSIIMFLGIFTIALISGERTAFILFTISLFFFFLSSNIDYKLKIFFFIMSLLITTLIISFNTGTNKRMIQQTMADLKTTNSFFKITKGHFSHWQSAYKMFEDNKFFGHGSNMYRKLCEEKKYLISSASCTTHPHNFYVQMLAENGLIGLLFLSYLFLKIAYYLLKNIVYKITYNKTTLTNVQLCFLICCLINFWPLGPTGNFFSSWLGNVYILPFAFIVNQLNINQWN